MARHVTKNPMLGKALDDSQTLIQQLSKEIRTTSYLLHPPLLDENGLPGAIHWYMQGLMERSGLTIDLDIAEDFGRLPSEMELAVFRIVQECLTNIHRHSGSKTATVRLSRSSDSVTLEIQDEGQGIPAEKLDGIHVRSGVGITGMRERVRHFHGAMDIHSNGAGTKILVTLPVSSSDTSEPERICCRSKGPGLPDKWFRPRDGGDDLAYSDRR
jgi:signal transduction histidine kinase